MDFLKNTTILTIILLLGACGNKNNLQNEIANKWLTFETEDYSIKYPPSWLVNQSGYMGTSFLIISKQTSIRDFYQENVSLVETVVDSSFNMEGFVQESYVAIEDSIQDFILQKDTLFNHQAGSCRWLMFEGREGLNRITTEKYYFLKDTVAYELTFSGKSLELGRYKTIGEGIMNSFRLK